MSGHLIGCVADVDDIGKSHKLALVAFADSADDRTHIGFPGYEGVQRWAACSRARAAELIADLVEAGYLAKHRAACRGRRAEYVVFPNGCCAVHRTPAAEPEHDVAAIAAAASVSIDQARAMLQALGTDAIADSGPDNDPGSARPNASETPDPLPLNGSENSDPFQAGTDQDTQRVQVRAGMGPKTRTRTDERVQNASEISDPSTTSTTSPPPPPSGGARCSRHPAGGGTNCRGCGTTNRQIAAAAQAAAAERRRAAERAAAEAQRQLEPVPLEVVAPLRLAARDAARDAVAASKAISRKQAPRITPGRHVVRGGR